MDLKILEIQSRYGWRLLVKEVSWLYTNKEITFFLMIEDFSKGWLRILSSLYNNNEWMICINYIISWLALVLALNFVGVGKDWQFWVIWLWVLIFFRWLPIGFWQVFLWLDWFFLCRNPWHLWQFFIQSIRLRIRWGKLFDSGSLMGYIDFIVEMALNVKRTGEWH